MNYYYLICLTAVFAAPLPVLPGASLIDDTFNPMAKSFVTASGKRITPGTIRGGARRAFTPLDKAVMPKVAAPLEAVVPKTTLQTALDPSKALTNVAGKGVNNVEKAVPAVAILPKATAVDVTAPVAAIAKGAPVVAIIPKAAAVDVAAPVAAIAKDAPAVAIIPKAAAVDVAAPVAAIAKDAPAVAIIPKAAAVDVAAPVAAIAKDAPAVAIVPKAAAVDVAAPVAALADDATAAVTKTGLSNPQKIAIAATGAVVVAGAAVGTGFGINSAVKN